MVSERAARTVLPAVSAFYFLDGVGRRRTSTCAASRASPGGFREATYNLVMGPPALAPGSLAMIGGIGLAAALARRER